MSGITYKDAAEVFDSIYELLDEGEIEEAEIHVNILTEFLIDTRNQLCKMCQVNYSNPQHKAYECEICRWRSPSSEGSILCTQTFSQQE